MSGVGIIGTIIIGLLAGWLAERFTSSSHGLITNLILGVVGAILFGWIAGRLGLNIEGWIANLIGGTLGAVLLIVAYRAVRRA
jgi:uncharacterized membrane protein YeaQ/YmgE (transglycosylase-associated protein family)